MILVREMALWAQDTGRVEWKLPAELKEHSTAAEAFGNYCRDLPLPEDSKAESQSWEAQHWAAKTSFSMMEGFLLVQPNLGQTRYFIRSVEHLQGPSALLTLFCKCTDLTLAVKRETQEAEPLITWIAERFRQQVEGNQTHLGAHPRLVQASLVSSTSTTNVCVCVCARTEGDDNTKRNKVMMMMILITTLIFGPNDWAQTSDDKYCTNVCVFERKSRKPYCITTKVEEEEEEKERKQASKQANLSMRVGHPLNGPHQARTSLWRGPRIVKRFLPTA